MQWKIVKPVVQPEMRKLCRHPYPNHPKGCPNFNKKDGCPPSIPLIDKTMDLNREVYAVWNEYPFGEHVEKMRKKHPDWSGRQLACCLYWQGTARKALCNELVTHIELEWPPEKTAYQIVLVGKRV